MTETIGVVILGMGRSGTSAVTRMFVNAGFFAGLETDLMPANESNPNGHWEHMSIWRANEKVLRELGGSWFDPPEVSSQLAARDWADPMLRSEFEKIDQQAKGAPVALKDPRIGVMMPLWSPIIGGYLHPVLVVRDPLEIALSLFHRDNMPVVCGLAAWELHMTTLLDQLASQTVTVAHYSDLILKKEMAPSLVTMTMGHIDSSRTDGVRPVDASTAFDSRFYRNRATVEAHNDCLSVFQLNLWNFLSQLPPGTQALNPQSEFRLPGRFARQTVRNQTERLECIEKYGQIDSDLATAYGLTTRLTRDLADTQKKDEQLLESLQAERSRLKALAATQSQIALELASIKRSTSWRLTGPLRRLARIMSIGSRK